MTLSIICAVAIAGLFGPGRQPSSAQNFKSYQLRVFCGNSPIPTNSFWHDVNGDLNSMGVKVVCAGNCPGGRVSLADALAGLPAGVSAALRSEVEKQAAAGKGRSVACVLDDKKPPSDKKPPKKPCENLPTNAKPPDWFDTGSCDGESESVTPWVGTQIVDGGGRLLPPGQVWCVANYGICRSSQRDSPDLIRVIKKVTIDLAAWNSDNSSVRSEAAMTACQSFIDEHKNAPQPSICCDTWEQARNRLPPPGSCYPISDVDCDGIPNDQDPFPFHPHSTEYTSYSPLTNFPFWKDFKNAVPHEPCECQWELIDARYTCSDVRVQNSARRGSSNQAKYDYQAKWKCPATGREIITTRQVTMPGLFCPRGRANR
jgi:hypothetical protein